jgi:hypothetical protein
MAAIPKIFWRHHRVSLQRPLRNDVLCLIHNASFWFYFFDQRGCKCHSIANFSVDK